MVSDDRFAKSLELGLAAENVVYDYLVQNNSLVQDLRQQKHKEHIGPRLVGTEGSIVLPDFAVYNKNPNKGTFAVDVKYKKSIYPALGKQCFTVDDKFTQYLRATQVMRLDFLMIIFYYNNRMYFYKDSDMIGTTTFDNKTYGGGLIYCFEHDESRIRY